MASPSPDSPDDGFSHIMPIGYSNSPNCGYCHGKNDYGKPKKRFSYYASTHSLSPGLYQSLVDRCWRRSGTLLYRPNQKNSCCPHYTIRLDSAAFHPTKDQRQAVNRFNRYVVGDAYSREAARLCPRSREEAKRRDATFDLIERIHEAESDKLPPLPPPRSSQAEKVAKEKVEGEKAPPATSASESYELTQPAHRFEVTLEPDTFTDEKFFVFENYQRVVHKEPPSKITRRGFESFLCNSPLRRETIADPDGRRRDLGSFHQCYRLDGRLVAIGVLDLLPHCVSAVYFCYHESVHQHSPGKIGALREIALALEGGYRWWYSGYYIHSCPKMRYKFDFSPQYVLDPETLTWDLLDKKALAIFDKKPYVSLSRERRLAKRAFSSNDSEQKRNAKGREGGKPHSGEDVIVAEPQPASTIVHTDEAGDKGNGTIDGGNEDYGNDYDDYDDYDLDDDLDEPLELGDDDESDGDGEGEAPLFTSNMPGLPPLREVAQYELDDILIQTTLQPSMFPVKYLVVWPSGTVLDGISFKSKVAELVAAMGVDLLPQLCLDFRRHA